MLFWVVWIVGVIYLAFDAIGLLGGFLVTSGLFYCFFMDVKRGEL